MSVIRGTTRIAGVAAVVAALALGLFAASAVGWYDKPGGNEETTPTETTPTETTPTETTPVEQPPVVEETPPLVAPVESPALPAPPAATEATPVPAPEVAPQEGVKGETGTRDEGSGGSAKPAVVAQATDVAGTAQSQSSGQLAKTGFNVLLLAILGGIALAGSSLLFWRSRTA